MTPLARGVDPSDTHQFWLLMRWVSPRARPHATSFTNPPSCSPSSVTGAGRDVAAIPAAVSHLYGRRCHQTCKSGCAKNLISRNGSTLSLLSSPLTSNISLSPSGKSSLEPRANPCPQEGRIAIVTDVGRGMRWTLWRRVDERRHGGRRSRVVLTPRRWRQLGDEAALHAGDGGKKPGSPGRARSKPLKPLRREGRVCRRTCGD
jgi:hypothetical protein